MRNRNILILAVLLVASVCMAQVDVKVIEVPVVGTTASNAVSSPIYGFVESLEIDFSSVYNTNTAMTVAGTSVVSIVTLTNANSGITHVLYTNATLSADTVLQPVRSVHNSAGTATNDIVVPFCLVGEKLKLIAQKSSTNTVAVKCIIKTWQ